MATSNSLTSRPWARLRDQVIREEPVCQLQFPDICTRVSTTGDHIIPVSERPDLALVRSNVRGACLPCNKTRSAVPDSMLRLGEQADPPALDVFR